MSIKDSIFTEPSALRAKYRNPKSVLGSLDEASSAAASSSASDSGGGSVQPTSIDSSTTYLETRREASITERDERSAPVNNNPFTY